VFLWALGALELAVSVIRARDKAEGEVRKPVSTLLFL
jgi:hypothetical protein